MFGTNLLEFAKRRVKEVKAGVFGNFDDESVGVVGEGAYTGFVELFVKGSRAAYFEEKRVHEVSVARGVFYSEFWLFLNHIFVAIFFVAVGSVLVVFVVRTGNIVGDGGVL